MPFAGRIFSRWSRTVRVGQCLIKFCVDAFARRRA
jgi:hypothetical protein